MGSGRPAASDSPETEMIAMRIRPTLGPALATAVYLLQTATAYAQAGASTTIGDRLRAAMSDMVGPLFFVISLVAFCGGLFLFAKGLIHLKDASSGGRGETGHALITLAAATCLILLPELAGVGITSIFGTDGLFTSNDLNQATAAMDSANPSGAQGVGGRIASMATVAAPTSCIGSSTPVDCMAKNIAQNAVPIGVITIFVVAFLAGLATFMSGLVELTKGDGRQSPAFWGKMVGAVALMNAIFFFLTASNSLLGAGVSTITTTGVDSSSSFLAYSNNNIGNFQQYADVIAQVFVILTFFGAFAFVKGVFMLKDAGEGKGQATYASGGVFMFAGVLLANAKYTSCLIITTVGGASSLAGMC